MGIRSTRSNRYMFKKQNLSKNLQTSPIVDVVNILVVEICAENVSGLVDVSIDEKMDKKEKN